jgi:hypothetical protein
MMSQNSKIQLSSLPFLTHWTLALSACAIRVCARMERALKASVNLLRSWHRRIRVLVECGYSGTLC